MPTTTRSSSASTTALGSLFSGRSSSDTRSSFLGVTTGKSSSRAEQTLAVRIGVGERTKLVGASVQALGNDQAGSRNTTATLSVWQHTGHERNTATESSQQASQRSSVGMAAQLSNGGIGVTVSASVGQGAGDSTTHNFSHVVAEQAVLQSGGDTTIKGGVLSGPPTSWAISSREAVFGGSSLTNTLFLKACPYRASCFPIMAPIL